MRGRIKGVRVVLLNSDHPSVPISNIYFRVAINTLVKQNVGLFITCSCQLSILVVHE